MVEFPCLLFAKEIPPNLAKKQRGWSKGEFIIMLAMADGRKKHRVIQAYNLLSGPKNISAIGLAASSVSFFSKENLTFKCAMSLNILNRLF